MPPSPYPLPLPTLPTLSPRLSSHVDAVGIAPYFGDGISYDASVRANNTLDGVFAALPAAVQAMRATLREHYAVVVTQYHKQVGG